MPYVRAREEKRYQERLLGLLRINTDRDTNVTLEVGRDALVFEYPYDRLDWLHRLVGEDESLTEARMRRN